MVVHKKTMGVLDTIWLGSVSVRAGKRTPRMRRATLTLLVRIYPDFRAEDYWEIPGDSRLARTIRRYYPFLEPVVGEDGELLDVRIIRKEREIFIPQEPESTSKKRGAAKCAVNALPWLRELLESE